MRLPSGQHSEDEMFKQYKWGDVAFFMAGGLLAIWGLAVWSVSNYNLGHLMMLGLGLLLAACGLLGPWLRVNMPRWLAVALAALVGLEMLLCGFLFAHGRIENVRYDEDAVIVLGAGLRGEDVTVLLALRLDTAYEYWQRNPDAYIVVSGGQGADEVIPEALAMRNYLLRRGVPDEVIIMEDKSTSTRENFRFSKAILDKKLKSGYKTAYVTTDFHSYRAGVIAAQEGLRSTHANSNLSWYLVPTNYLRESVGVIKLWTLDKLLY